MRKRKIFIAILCAVILVFSFAFVGCNGNSDNKNNPSGDEQEWTPNY